jgi:hypothetical protein
VTQFNNSPVDDTTQKMIESLDARYVYNTNFKALTLSLIYPNNENSLEIVAKNIQTQLSNIGVVVDIK